MGFIKRFLEKQKEKKAKFKEMQDELQMQKLLEERQLSSNERELNKYLKEEHDKRVKLELDKYRKARADEYNYGHNPLHAPHIIKDQKALFKNKYKLEGGNMYQKEKRLFLK